MALASRFSTVNSTRFQSDRPLDNDQLMQYAPSIFAAAPHDSRSDKYTYIPTIKVLDGLRDEGFQPFMVCQSKTRIAGKEDFTKHMLRLRQPGEIVAPEAHEIILINSHDGTSSYQMLGGIFRFVCHNGMVCGSEIEDIRVPHRGNIVDNVIDAAYTIVDQFDMVDQSMDAMKALPLNAGEQEALAGAALALKYDEGKEPISAYQLAGYRRYEDKENSLWATFNRIQENLLKGGQRGRSATGRRITTRPVQAIDNDVKLNRALWMLADSMAALKGAIQ